MEMALRPTFVIRLSAPPDSVAQSLHQQLVGGDLETRWSRVPGASSEKSTETHALVTLTAAHRRFWSPWLHLDVRNHEGGTELFGRYSPHPNVWTAFALAYLLLGAVVFLGSMFALSQMMLHGSSQAWWAVGAAIFIASGMWWSAQLGQKLARDQMERLDAQVQAAVSSLS